MPPKGLRLVFGVTEETTRGTLIGDPEVTGIRPLGVVTIGYQPLPAMAVRVQVI